MTEKYPRVRWVLYHCARTYSAWPLMKAASRLKNIPNLWYETSSVCETDAFYALFSSVDPKRICYGSDDLPVGVTRGKYVAWGYSWTQMDENNQTFNKAHCDGRMTFVRYEMLRAMRGFLRENDMMAYLAMMTVRLIELHRVLKPTGSLYLHCDPTATPPRATI